MHFDLAADDMRRQEAMLAAMDWDPIEMLTSEAEAHRLLYSNLDAAQQKIYDELVAAGVIPAY